MIGNSYNPLTDPTFYAVTLISTFTISLLLLRRGRGGSSSPRPAEPERRGGEDHYWSNLFSALEQFESMEKSSEDVLQAAIAKALKVASLLRLGYEVVCPHCHRNVKKNGVLELRPRIVPTLGRDVVVELVHSGCGAAVWSSSVEDVEVSASMSHALAIEQEGAALASLLSQQPIQRQEAPPQAAPPPPPAPIGKEGELEEEEPRPATPPHPPRPAEASEQNPDIEVETPSSDLEKIVDSFYKCGSCPYFENNKCGKGIRKGYVYPSTRSCTWWDRERLRIMLQTKKIPLSMR